MKKGTFGYIDHKKRFQLIKTIITFLIAITIFVIGLLLNKFSKQNVFTILAVLIILPASKSLVGYIVLFPFRSVDKKIYDDASVKADKPDNLFTDLVLTSNEKVMNLSFLYITENLALGLSQYKKSDDKYITQYLQRMIDGRQLPYRVNILKDKDKFLKELEKRSSSDNEPKDINELKSLISSLLV